MASNSNDLFRESCAHYKQYPGNLLRKVIPKHRIEEWQEKLKDGATKYGLFDGTTEPYVGFLELRDGGKGIEEAVAEDQSELEAHLQQSVNDARFRYISLESSSSRAALDCSLAMFTYLFSYLQIPESLLDYVFTFGKTSEAKDVGLTGFQADDTLSLPPDRKIGISSLGRSGSEIRLSYLLRVVEKSSSPDTALISQWVVRQLVVYHSFDVINGRALWMTVKGNEETKDHIHSAFKDDEGMRPSSAQGAPGNFKTTLRLQLLLLESCEENVRWHLNEVDSALRNISNIAKTVKLDTEPHFETLPEDIKQEVLRRDSSNLMPATTQDSLLSRVGTGLSSLFSGKATASSSQEKPTVSDRIKTAVRSVSKPNLGASQDAGSSGGPTRLENYLKLDLFIFDDLQKLQQIAETVQEGLLAVEMNATVLRDVKTHYSKLMESGSMPSDIRSQCKSDVEHFIRRIEGLESSLGRKQKQWENLEKLARDGKTLYDGILQYRSLQVNRIYAESAHTSALRMQKIAEKTEKDTGSMHIITISLLQSGVFELGTVDLGESTWKLNVGVFNLFIVITATAMVVTFMVWVVVYKCGRNRSRRMLNDVEAGMFAGSGEIEKPPAK
ncbi:hypothetical protein PG988_011399 [Apiospora saccharicola]